MPVTLTDEQVAKLNQRLAAGDRAIPIADASTKLWNDPKWGNEVKSIWKQMYPEEEIQGFDTEQRINARLDKERAEREDERRKERERAEDEDIARKRKTTQEKHKFTDDAMDRLEKLMIEKKVADYEIAAHWLTSQEPAPSEGTADYDRQFWRHDKTPEYQEIAKDPEGYGRREILKTLKEMQAKYPGYR